LFGPWTYLNLNHLNSTRFKTIRFATKYSRTQPRRKTRPYSSWFQISGLTKLDTFCYLFSITCNLLVSMRGSLVCSSHIGRLRTCFCTFESGIWNNIFDSRTANNWTWILLSSIHSGIVWVFRQGSINLMTYIYIYIYTWKVMIHTIVLKVVTLPLVGNVLDFETSISKGAGVTDFFFVYFPRLYASLNISLFVLIKHVKYERAF